MRVGQQGPDVPFRVRSGGGRPWTSAGRALALALPAALLLPAPPAAAGGREATCRGERAVLITDEFFGGTAGRDVIVVSVADVDEVWGGLDDDLICVYGDPRNAYHGLVVSGGPGNDTIVTYGGANDVYGDDGNDIIYLNGTDEHAEGGAGDDHVWSLGADGVAMYGGDGTDMLQGSPAGDTLDGGNQGDLLIGAGGDDTLEGRNGDDTLQGGAGTDGSDQDSCQDGPPAVFSGCETIVGGPGGIGLAG
jgi:hypothetical protein